MNSKNIFDYISHLENENIELKNNNFKLTNQVNDIIEELNNLKKVSIMLNFNKQLKEKENTILSLENQLRNIRKKNNNKTDNDIITQTEIIEKHVETEKPNKKSKKLAEKPVESTEKPVEVVELAEKPVEVVESTEKPVVVESTEKPVEVVEVTEKPVEQVEVTEKPVEQVEVTEEQVEVTEEQVTEKPIEKPKEEAVDSTEKKKKKKPKNCEIIKYKTNEYLLNNDTNEIFNIDDRKLSESIGMLKNGKVKFYKKE